MDSLSPIFAKRLKELRESKGISLATLSNALTDKYGIQISKESLTNYEVASVNHTKAKKNEGMSVKYLRCLADFYGVSTDYLLGITDIPNTDAVVQAAHEFTGLSGQALDFLKKSHTQNPMYWRTDAINFLLENEKFPVLLDMIIGFATSKDENIQSGLRSNNSFPIVTDRDIFRAKASDLLSWILTESNNYFAEKEDYRSYYRLYYAAFRKGASIDDVQEEMKENGLIFDRKMFGDGD